MSAFSPTVSLAEDDAFHIEWHEAGLDIELIVGDGAPIVLIEDARGEIAEFADEDHELHHTAAALRRLFERLVKERTR